MELVEYQYTEGNSIMELVAFFCTKNAWLAGMKKDFNGETFAFLILHSLPKTQEWKNVISNIVQSQPSSSWLTIPIVEAQLLQIERLQCGQEHDSALAAACTRPIQTQAPSVPTSITTVSPNKGHCQNCHKGFHATENCQAPRGAKEGIPYPEHDRKQGGATAALTWERSSHAFLASLEEKSCDSDLNSFLVSHSALNHLVLDSGCSIHMLPCKGWFIPGTLKKLPHNYSIHVANGQELKVSHAAMAAHTWLPNKSHWSDPGHNCHALVSDWHWEQLSPTHKQRSPRRLSMTDRWCTNRCTPSIHLHPCTIPCFMSLVYINQQ